MFKVGQKLICIAATGNLVNGKIYTVSEVFPERQGVRVREAKNLPGFFSFKGERFKPVDEDFTDNVLNEIIKQIKEEELRRQN